MQREPLILVSGLQLLFVIHLAESKQAGITGGRMAPNNHTDA